MTTPSRREFVAASPPTDAPRASVRLPLHDELYLIAHDGETSATRIHPRPPAVGLAGAVLITLLMERRGNLWDERITIARTDPPADTIPAAGWAAVRNGPTMPPVGLWLRSFGDVELYERIRANLVAVGILRRQTRRLRGDAYPAVHHAWGVRVGARLRSVLTGREPPDPQCAALCGLIGALGLQDHLAPGRFLDPSPPRPTHRRLSAPTTGPPCDRMRDPARG